MRRLPIDRDAAGSRARRRRARACDLAATPYLLALPICLAGCTGDAEPPPRPNVLLVTIDTLRADRLSLLGSAHATTPRLDAFAAEALVFTHCQSPRAKTTPAVASLLSGLYPHGHGVRDLGVPIARDVPLLSEALRAAGWRTGAVIGNYVLKRELAGLERGFETWIEELPDSEGVPPDDVPERRARSLTDAALALLGLAPSDTPPSGLGDTPPSGLGDTPPLATGDAPWFVWLHYMDPHGAYVPPAEHDVFRSPPEAVSFVDPDGDDPSDGTRWIAEYNVPDAARLADGRFDAARVRDLYDGEVRYADAEIGRLLDALRDAGELANTLVVVTSDHGESLGEHDYWFEHGRYAYEATCRVPLVVRLPDAWPERPAPALRTGDVALADLAPTLLDLLVLPPLATSVSDADVRGVSRRALVLDGDDAPHPVFCEKIERADLAGAVQTKAVRIGDWKLIRRYAHADRENGTRALVVLGDELYDLAADPAEARDLAAAQPPAAPLAELRAALFLFARSDVRFQDLADELQRARDELERLDPETVRVLRALGY